MLDLYHEISGRGINQEVNEETPFDLIAHATAANPYAHQAPRAVAKLMMTLVQAVAAADKPKDSEVLDMGAGWGLSSEIFEFVGYRVTAVDISERFVQLVNVRAKNRGLLIKAVQSSFDKFQSSQRFDIAVFFECLHHSVTPWTLLSHVSALLKDDGVLLLLAEPVQDIWWRNWGLRLDPLSIYCIRKHGWFESGWSASFLFQMLSRAGFSTVSVRNRTNPDHAIYLCRKSTLLTRNDLEQIIDPDQVWPEPEYLVSKGDISFEFAFPGSVSNVVIEIWSFRARPLSLGLQINGADSIPHTLDPGRNRIPIPYFGGRLMLRIVSECWSPEAELGNVDKRYLSFHLASIRGQQTNFAD